MLTSAASGGVAAAAVIAVATLSGWPAQQASPEPVARPHPLQEEAPLPLRPSQCFAEPALFSEPACPESQAPPVPPLPKWETPPAEAAPPPQAESSHGSGLLLAAGAGTLASHGGLFLARRRRTANAGAQASPETRSIGVQTDCLPEPLSASSAPPAWLVQLEASTNASSGNSVTSSSPSKTGKGQHGRRA